MGMRGHQGRPRPHLRAWELTGREEGEGFSGSPRPGVGSEPGLIHMDSLSSWKVSLLAKLCGVSSKGKQEVKSPS